MKKLTLLFCLLALATPARGQHARKAFSGISFVSPFRMTIGHDSNFLIDRSTRGERLFFLSLSPSVQPKAPNALPKQFDDQVLLFSLPTMGYLNDSSRRDLAVTYQPEFEIFRYNDDQNSLNHTASANFTYFLTRKTQISASDTFRTSNDPSRVLQNVFLLLPRNKYKENALRAALNHDISGVTSVGIRFDHTISSFGQTDPFQRRILDTTGKGLSFIGSHMLARNHRVRGTYTVFAIRPVNTQGEGDDEVDRESPGIGGAAHSFEAEYRFTINPITVFNMSGGVVRTQGGLNYTFGGSVDRRFGEMWLGAGYSRSLAFFTGATLPNGLTPTSFYDVVFARWRGQPTRTIGIEILAQGSRSVDSNFAESLKSALGRARLDYRWTDRTVTFLSYESYQQSRNEYVGSPLSRNRFVAGIEVSLASQIEQRTSRLNRDAENVGLVERHRRRAPQ